MNINATLFGQVILIWIMVTTAVLYWFYYRKGLITGVQLVINVLIQFVPLFGFLYTFYLLNKYKSHKKSA